MPHERPIDSTKINRADDSHSVMGKTSMKTERPRRGLLVCAAETDDGSMRITLDDIARKSDDGSRWDLDCFVTSKDYDETRFDQLDFDDKELAAFGYYILARLWAFKECGDL